MASPFAASAATSSNGTIPHTIEQAVNAFRSQHRSAAPIDILAVVVNVETSEKLARLWIRDASLPQGHKAQVLFFGKKKRGRIVDELRILPGDVIRCNRIDLRKDQDGAGTPEAYAFWHSFDDPEPGAEFFRLCHVDGATGRVETSTDIAVPDSMQTNQACLDELILWYRGSDFVGQTPALQPLPCQHRSLAEFHSCLGVVGHVVAHVIQVEACTRVAKRGKRKKAQAPAEPSLAIFATLTDDDSATLTTFYLDNSISEHQRFQKVLEQARDEKRPVRLSRVVAKSASRLQTSIRNDEILIVPTSDSDVALADREEIDQFLSRKENATTQTQGGASIANFESINKDVLDIRSPILDIIVKGVSLAQQQTKFLNVDEASSSLNHLLKYEHHVGASFVYSSATITLGDRELGEVNVKADGAIVKLLCGGLDLDEWSPSRFLDHEPTAYNQLVIDVIRGLLTESVELRWEIERLIDRSGGTGRTCYQVLGVSLPEL